MSVKETRKRSSRRTENKTHVTKNKQSPSRDRFNYTSIKDLFMHELK